MKKTDKICSCCASSQKGTPEKLVVLPIKTPQKGLLIWGCPVCDGELLSYQ